MKRTIIFIVTIFSFTSYCFIACGPSAAEKEKNRVKRQLIANPVVWDTIYVDEKEAVGLDTLGTLCTVNIQFIVPKEYQNTEILRSIQQELNYALIDEDSLDEALSVEMIKKYAADYIVNYIEDAKKDYSLWKSINTPMGSYTKEIESDVIFDEANLISYQLKGIEYSGTDTTSVIYENLLFDLTDGRKLSEEDIFKEGYKGELNKMLTEQLLKMNRVTTVGELQDLGYWGAADIAANDNFYVDTDGITYTYNPGEYADSKLGVLNIRIGYDHLLSADILRNPSPISILYKAEEE